MLTIATPFAGRLHCLAGFLESLDSQVVNKAETCLLWYDNSSSAEFGARLEEEAQRRRSEWGEIRVVHDPTKVAADLSTNTGKHYQVARTWKQASLLVRTPFVLCWEEDVQAPPEAAHALMAILSMNPQYAALSAAVPYRHYHEPVTGVMVWDLNHSGGSFSGARADQTQVSYHLPIRAWGTEVVGATGFAFLMLRNEVLQSTPISAEAMPRLGFDQLFGLRLQEAGLKLAVHWDTRCVHYHEVAGIPTRVTVPMAATVDIVIPCFGAYHQYLPEVLASVLAQSMRDCISAVVVVTGETDEATKVAFRDFPDKPDTFRLLEVLLPIPGRGQGMGPRVGISRNAGARAGTAPYLLFLDADDKLPAKYLERNLDRLERIPWAAYTVPAVMTFGDWDDFVPPSDLPPSSIVGVPSKVVPPAACLMRRTTWETAGGFPEDLNDELDGFWHQCYQEGLFGVPNAVSPPYLVRVHRNGASGQLQWDKNAQTMRDHYPRAYQRPQVDSFVLLQNGNPYRDGGDSVQVDQLREGLWHLNFGADLRREYQALLTHYPVIHAFGLGDEWTSAYLHNARAQGKPAVVSAIWHLPQPAGRTNAGMATVIVCASEGEMEAILKYTGADPSKFRVIPHGVDRRFLDSRIPPPTSIEPGYLLCVGRFDKEKNQLRLLDALEGTGMSVVFVGPLHDYAGDPGYYQQCATHPYPYKHFAGPLPYQVLPSYYRGAQAVALVSMRESAGLPLWEGAAAGCNLVVSRGSLAWRDFAGQGEVCDPLQTDSVREAVLHAMQSPRSPKRPPMVWTAVAAQYAALYREVISPW